MWVCLPPHPPTPQLPLVSDRMAAFFAAILAWFNCVTVGPIICSSKLTNCGRRLACDRGQLFVVIVHLGIPGVCDLDWLLNITSVSLGIPGEMGLTSSSISFNSFIIFFSTNYPNHHESVDRLSADFRCFWSISLVHK